MTLDRPRPAVALVGVGVVTLVALSGCTGGVSSGSSAAGDTADSGSAAFSAPQAAGRLSDTSKPANASVVVQQQAVIKNGDIVLHTADPQQARDRVDDLLTRLRGSVDDEQTVYDKHGVIRDSRLVLRVPVASFPLAMDGLEHLGTVVHSSTTGQDVTTQVIDVQQRLRTLRISLQDLNSFQRRATTIDQLLRFESAITQRRGEYQSLKAQRDHLLSQTSMSTINVDISVPPRKAAAAAHHDAGFLTGLRHGWAALTGTVVVALTAVGAVLPFAVVLAAVGLPLWWWARRHWRAGPAATPAEAASAD